MTSKSLVSDLIFNIFQSLKECSLYQLRIKIHRCHYSQVILEIFIGILKYYLFLDTDNYVGYLQDKTTEEILAEGNFNELMNCIKTKII